MTYARQLDQPDIFPFPSILCFVLLGLEIDKGRYKTRWSSPLQLGNTSLLILIGLVIDQKGQSFQPPTPLEPLIYLFNFYVHIRAIEHAL